VSDNAVASTGEQTGARPAEDDVLAELTAPVPEVGDGGPEMVQLLTP
jgi:2-oxoisovalerate dehydrogenase E1 component alpha subunit